MKMLKKLKSILINSLYPQNIKCVACFAELSQNSHYIMCEKCLLSLPKNSGKSCNKCGEPIKTDANFCLRCKGEKPVFNRCFSPLLYESPVNFLIKEFKYGNKKYLSKTLGAFLVESYIINNLNCDVVVPVPLHLKRQKNRGFNQAELLANELNKKLGLQVISNNLVRVKNTITQTNLSKVQRQQNVSKAFNITDKSFFKNKVVLVIDDVYTTGSTLNECAKELFKSGAKKVYCLTIAHTMVSKVV